MTFFHRTCNSFHSGRKRGWSGASVAQQASFQQPFSYEEPSMTTSFIKSIASLVAAAGLLTASAAFGGGEHSGCNHSASMHNNSGKINSNKFLSNTIKTNNQFVGTNKLS